MNFRRLFLVAFAGLCITNAIFGANPTADAAWKKVQSAMSYVAPEKIGRQSNAGSFNRYGVAIAKFDEAMKDFRAASPDDPRLWEARVFDVTCLSPMRGRGGLPP